MGSVRARTAAASVTVVGCAILAGALGLLALMRHSLTADIDRAVLQRTEDVADLVRAGALPEHLPLPADEDADDLVVQVVSASGVVKSSSANLVGAAPLLPGPPPASGATRIATVQGLPVDPADTFRVVAVTIPSADGPTTIYAATELGLVQKTLAAMRHLLLTWAPGFLLLLAAVTWYMVGRALRPVEAIRARVAGISAEALDRRVPEPPGDDEITRLARTMNAMLDRLQVASERQRRFVADASHELKSPLAAVQAELEVALAHPGQADWEATATRLLDEDRRMERLVADLIFLAQCDEGDAFFNAALVAEEVDVDAVVAAEVTRLGPTFPVPVEVLGRSGARVLGRPEHLGRVVRNLLENAARHARSAVTVTLGVTAHDEVEMVVADDGPGVAPADRSRVFDRFTRLDDGRSRDDGGSGLGLPIAREIVGAHGGRIVFGEGPGGRLVVRLPLGVEARRRSGVGHGGEPQDKARARTGVLHGDHAAVGLGDVPHDRQS